MIQTSNLLYKSNVEPSWHANIVHTEAIPVMCRGSDSNQDQVFDLPVKLTGSRQEMEC